MSAESGAAQKKREGANDSDEPGLLECMKKKTRQREFSFVNLGGKRRGAGRKPKGERRGVSHAKRPRLAPSYPVQVTMRLVAGLPSLRASDTHALIRQALKESTRSDFRVVEFSIQSNHLHLLVEAQDQRALSRGMLGLSTRLARRVNKLWRRRGRLFADRYHARILRTPREVRVALVYVLQNARKHGALIARAADVYSSGPEFDGWREKGAESERLLERPRTWLLARGWRRHGLLGLLELPKGAAQPLPARATA